MNPAKLMEHWFWFLLTIAALVWYSTVTVYVAVQGVRDIRTMFRRLSSSQSKAPPRSDVAEARTPPD